MPCDVFEEPFELEIGVLEAGRPTAESYPYPHLVATGQAAKRTFRALVLENAYLRATFLPALGGRLFGLYDKRTNMELFPSDTAMVSGGRRGVRLSAGVELHLDGEERLTSLGAVQFAAIEPDEDGPAGLWLGEAITGTGLSWHLKVTLPEDRAELTVEARIFNRSFREIPYSAGLMLPSMNDSTSNGNVFVTSGNHRGVALIPDRGTWSSAIADGRLVVSRFGQTRMLAPRQLDSWVVRLVPISGLASVTCASRSASMFIGDDLIQLQATEPLGQHKLVLLTKRGQTLETPVHVHPEQVIEMTPPEPLAGVVLMDALKRTVLRWDGDWPEVVGSSSRKLEPSRSDRSDPSDSTDQELEQDTFDVSRRHYAHTLLGMHSLARSEFDEAEARFESALHYNAEDHLTWWMKAVAGRLSGAQAEDVPELLNAHYLAPLEPALRAESFLAQPATMEKEPTALLRTLAEYPETFIEVAALLVEAELYEQASRWIDEALRHIDLAMLRYLLAFAHIKATSMEFEAQDHLTAAAKAPVGPPYPWRKIEIEALRKLRERFPDDKRLLEFGKLAGI